MADVKELNPPSRIILFRTARPGKCNYAWSDRFDNRETVTVKHELLEGFKHYVPGIQMLRKPEGPQYASDGTARTVENLEELVLIKVHYELVEVH